MDAGVMSIQRRHREVCRVSRPHRFEKALPFARPLRLWRIVRHGNGIVLSAFFLVIKEAFIADIESLGAKEAVAQFPAAPSVNEPRLRTWKVRIEPSA